MSVSLDPAVLTQLDEGPVSILPLVKFDLPGLTVGYHFGGRTLVYGGVTYKPNRWLSPDSFAEALGNDVTTRVLVFSNVPTDDPADAMAAIETYDYLNAPVVISYLCGDPETDEILGVLATHYYEINAVRFSEPAVDQDGLRTLSLEVEIEPPGRRVRDVTHAKRSQDEQQFDNLATDTFFEYVATSPEFIEEWGQR